MSSTARAWSSATRAPTAVTHAGWLRLPRCGTGARYGLSVSTSRESIGHSLAASWRSVADGNVTIPLNDSIAPRSRQRRASSGPPVKQCNTVRSGTPSAEIGRAHIRTPVTNSHHVYRLLLEKKHTHTNIVDQL